MPKKLNIQTEQNGHTLTREDRKNEQICRMIEKAEKQRIKREEKKKLAVSTLAPHRTLPPSKQPLTSTPLAHHAPFASESCDHGRARRGGLMKRDDFGRVSNFCFCD